MCTYAHTRCTICVFGYTTVYRCIGMLVLAFGLLFVSVEKPLLQVLN